jgi:hypothetical protein
MEAAEMLFSPHWEQRTTVDPLSLDSLVAWLETQPPKRRYSYRKPHACLVAQWLKASGAQEYALSVADVSALFGGRGDLVVLGPLLGTASDRTFGAALVRARAALAEASSR